MPRPLEHCRDDVIAAATEVFWDKGYAGTSMADLKTATGLNSGSIYSSYKSKEDLFIATLESYCKESIHFLESTLSESADHIQNIYRFFEHFDTTQKQQSKGCFFVNALIDMAPHNTRVKKLLSDYTDQYRCAFEKTLKHAQDAQQLPKGLAIKTKAEQLMLTIWGLRVMHRSDLGMDTRAIIQQQLNDIL